MLNTTDLSTGTKSLVDDLTQPLKKVVLGQTKQNGSEEAIKQGDYKRMVIILALTLFLFVLIKNAWLSDDSYITLRTVYNFIHGYGLTWNVDERVQTFTHPLWMFLLSGSYFFIRSIYFSSLLLSLVVSVLAIALFAFRLTPSPFVAVMGLAILAASKSFIDFSTSGLENPLTHLLIVLFALVFFQKQQSKRYLLWLSLLGSAMILNRMDTVLLFLPTLIYAWYKAPQSKLKALKTILLAFAPFILWEIFSLFYYGFLFPNTAYAKLDTGISTGQLLKQGLAYFFSSFTFDPLLFFVLVCAIFLVIIKRDWKSIPILLGMLLYMAYIVKVGGDFMAGRFLTPPFLMAVILLMRNIPSTEKIIWASICAAVIVLGFFVPNSRWYVINTNTQFIDARGVADEHSFYAPATALINFQRNIATPHSCLAQIGDQLRLDQDNVFNAEAIGYMGYQAGPQVHIVDSLALGDPLLARLPLATQVAQKWRIGHFRREIPAGYIETLQTGVNVIQDPGLAQYYAHLHHVVSGSLFDGQRFIEIWNLNTGGYNSLLKSYIQSLHSPSHVQATIPDIDPYVTRMLEACQSSQGAPLSLPLRDR